jgi:hypothetical protein
MSHDGCRGARLVFETRSSPREEWRGKEKKKVKRGERH